MTSDSSRFPAARSSGYHSEIARLDAGMTGLLAGCRTVTFGVPHPSSLPPSLPPSPLRSVAAAGPDGRVGVDALLTPETLTALIDRYAATHPPGTDRRGVASIWSQSFFGVLLPPLALALVAYDLPVRADVGGWTLLLSDAGLPQRFEIALVAPDAPQPPLRSSLWALMAVVDPLVGALHGGTRLSRRVLWNSVGNVLEWSLREQGRECPALGDRLDPALTVFSQTLAPDGSANPLYRPVTYLGDVRVRTVCCLRNRLDGLSNCGNCPLDHAEALGAAK